MQPDDEVGQRFLPEVAVPYTLQPLQYYRSYNPFSTVVCLTKSGEDTVSPGSSGIKFARTENSGEIQRDLANRASPRGKVSGSYG